MAMVKGIGKIHIIPKSEESKLIYSFQNVYETYENYLSSLNQLSIEYPSVLPSWERNGESSEHVGMCWLS